MGARVRALLALTFLTAAAACESAEPAARDLPHPRALQLPEPSFERPDPVPLQHALDNGLMTYLVEDHAVPMVTVMAVIGAGSASDSRQGSAETLVGVMRRRGPATRSAGDFRAALERMVAEYSVTQTAEETTLELNVPSEDWTEALGILADVIRSPALGDAEVRAAAAPLLDAAPAASGSADRSTAGSLSYEGSLESAVALMEMHVFSGHPFGRRPTPVEIRTLNAAAVRAFHTDFFVPGNVVVAVAGDFDGDEARRVLDEALSGWTARPVPAAVDFPPAQSDGQREVLAYPADKLQAWLVLGHDLPVVSPEDEAPLHVMNYVLGGGHFDTRLFRETRDRRGLTNDDSGFLSPGIRGPGTYTFRTYGRPEVAPLLVHLTLQEIDRIRTEAISEEELFVATGALADGEYTLSFRDGRRTALTFAREWLRFGGHERSATYQSRIRAVTPQAVLDVAQRILRPDRLDLVVVGPLDAVLAAPALEGASSIESFGPIRRP